MPGGPKTHGFTASHPGGALGRGDQLLLAEVALRGLEGTSVEQNIVVIGPTQAGKSTLVNRIAAADVVGVSPRAGFTRRAARVRFGGSEARGLIASAVAEPVDDPSRPARGPLDAVCVAAPCEADWSGIALWDTPDFDSLAAHDYRASLLGALASADLLICVLTREKYADLAVWQLLDFVAPLDRRLLICLNKMTPDVEPVIRSTLSESLAARPQLARTVAGVIAHPLESPGDDVERAARELRRSAHEAVREARRDERPRGVARLVRLHWRDWTRAIQAEHAALDRWRACVSDELDALQGAYARDVLDHPDRNVAFARTIQALLELLELPGLSRVARQARAVTSWPWRRLAELVRRRRSTPGASSRPGEPRYLSELAEHLLLRLERTAAGQRISAERNNVQAAEARDENAAGSAFWMRIEQRLAGRGTELRRMFLDCATNLHEQLRDDIRAAAESLYERLRERPALLNSLRAARVTADAASLLLAIKTAGLGATDLLLGPAFFGVVSLLTESAVGSYVGSVAAGLRRKQLELFRRRLLEDVLQPELIALATAPSAGEPAPITPAELADATAALEEWTRAVGE